MPAMEVDGHEKLPQFADGKEERQSDPTAGPAGDSAVSAVSATVPASAPAPATASDSDFRPETLRLYYRWLFPFREMHQWLCYGHDKKIPGSEQSHRVFSHREFSFTLENDIYIRFQSFRDAADMEAKILEKLPHKIDIGAVYKDDVSRKTQLQGMDRFQPVERELVFDVDMTDYDDMRTCCTGAKVCERCWTLMTVAIKVVDRALREDFGYEHLLWVFSGRRGVHCWVCDSRARRLSDEQRAAITEYFRVYQGSEGNSRKVSFPAAALHPSLLRAFLDILLPAFEGKIVADQRLLENEAAWTKVLACIPDEEVRERLAERWRRDRRGEGPEASIGRWKQLEATVRQAARQKQSLRKSVEEIVFAYAYPRLDLEVSKHMNHLLKAPFCVHPKTGKVCVPIDPAQCEAFNPADAPTLSQLMEELNNSGMEVKEGKDSGGRRATSLDPYVESFRNNFLGKLMATCKDELAAQQKQRLLQQRAQGTMAW